jgi:hypothetical protein
LPGGKHFLSEITGIDIRHLSGPARISKVDQKAVLLATVDDHFLLPSLLNFHFESDVSKAVVFKEAEVKLREFLQHFVVAYGQVTGIGHRVTPTSRRLQASALGFDRTS